MVLRKCRGAGGGVSGAGRKGVVRVRECGSEWGAMVQEREAREAVSVRARGSVVKRVFLVSLG